MMRIAEFSSGMVINRRYEVIATIGRGGMGTVVKARRLKDGEIVAIKYCHLSDSDSLRRFSREVRIMKMINHPNVVPVLKISLKHSPPYFVMPFAESSCGACLDDYAADESKAIAAFLDLCEDAKAIHNAGTVHRDIKPDNALIIDGKVVLSDLGLAKLNDRDTAILTHTRAIVGTDMYLAPEQRLPAGSRDADHRTDIYQLGKTLYQLLTGLDPVLLDMGKVPSGLAHVIRRATRDLPQQRYETVGQFIDAIKAYQRAQAPDANPINLFEAALNRISEQLERGEYREKDIQQVFAALLLDPIQTDPEIFLELFDRLPVDIIKIMTDVFHNDFQPVLEAYVCAIDAQVRGMPFPYAESVAKKMRVIFRATDATPELKALSLEAALIAAVRLGRFAAMDSFNAMLPLVKDDADAAAVREALERRRSDYATVCESVPSIRLHPTIRALRDELAEAASSE